MKVLPRTITIAQDRKLMEIAEKTGRKISEQLKELGGIIGNFFNDTLLKTKGFSDWLEVFTYLKEKHGRKFIV